MASEIKVDTVSEKTSGSGVTIDGLLIKDGGISGDVSLIGTTPTFTIGDAGAEDAALVFDGNAKDFYIALDDSADKLVIGEGSTVGTNSILTITDDSVTIGDAAAVDTKIVFDGNAQDFYIGLDDSADDLIIGHGSTVGTNPAISIDESQNVTIADGSIDFNIASHDTSNGLKLGGTLVTATAAELNIMDGVTATAAEINLIDGGTARGTTAIADGDGVLINDAGTMRQTTVETLKTYIGGFDVSSITGATALTTQPAATDEIVLSDAGTLKRLDIKHIQATPAFAATVSSSTGIGHNSYTRIQCNTEVLDSDGTYDNSSNYRFTPGVAGKYFIAGMVAIGSGTGVNNAERVFVALYKNGSKYQQAVIDGRDGIASDTLGQTCVAIMDLDADDYVELYTKFFDGGSSGSNNYYTDSTTFQGFRITGV